MTVEDDALGFVAAMHEESTRQLAQLRVTLEAKIDSAQAKADAEGVGVEAAYHDGQWDAYCDVLSLLGPEPAWSTDNDAEPF